MRRLLVSAALVLVALVLQLTVLDRLALPGGVSPDLVLLVVVGLALSNGPLPGLVTGFCAGLALDLAPPAGHLIGLYALVFCLVGYGCGLISGELESSVLLPLGACALGAAGGATLYAAAGVMLGNPDVSGQAVRHVLPMSVAYDVLLSPFVLYGVALANRLAARLAGVADSAGDMAMPLQSAGIRQARQARQGGQGLARPAGATPRIRAAAARQRDGWIGGGWLSASAELARSRPVTVRLRFGSRRHSGVPGSAARSARRSAMAASGGGAGGKSVSGLRFGGGLLSGRSALGTAGWRPWRRQASLTAGRPASPRLHRRSSWGGARAATSVSTSAPRRGTFSSGPARSAPPRLSTPRARTFSAGSARRVKAGSAGRLKAGAARKPQLRSSRRRWMLGVPLPGRSRRRIGSKRIGGRR